MHFDEMTCLMYLEGQLEEARAQEISAHTATCAECSTLLHALETESLLLAGSLIEEDEMIPARLLSAPGLKKVRHIVRRGDKSLFVVNGALHFGLPLTSGLLVFVLRRTRTALLIDGLENMTTLARPQAWPQAFCHEKTRR